MSKMFAIKMWDSDYDSCMMYVVLFIIHSITQALFLVTNQAKHFQIPTLKVVNKIIL